MKLIGISMLLSASLLVSARGDLTITEKTEGVPGMGETTIKIKGDMARVEVNPQVTTIIDGKTGDVKTLMKEKKKVVHISPEKAKALSEMASQFNKTPAGKPKLVPTGKKETISGYEAEEYKVENGMFEASYWITTKYPDYQAILKELQKIRPANMEVVKTGMPDYSDCPGLPIRTLVLVPGQGEITTTILSIKKDPVPDDQFVVPKDFTEMPMPDFSNQKQSSTSPAPKKP